MGIVYLHGPQLRKSLRLALENTATHGTLSHLKAFLWHFFVGPCAEEIARKTGVTFWPDALDLNRTEWFMAIRERLGLRSLHRIKTISQRSVYEDDFGDAYLSRLLQK